MNLQPVAAPAATQVIAAGTSATNLATESRWSGAQSAPYVCCWGSQGQYVTFSFNAARRSDEPRAPLRRRQRFGDAQGRARRIGVGGEPELPGDRELEHVVGDLVGRERSRPGRTRSRSGSTGTRARISTSTSTTSRCRRSVVVAGGHVGHEPPDGVALVGRAERSVRLLLGFAGSVRDLLVQRGRRSDDASRSVTAPGTVRRRARSSSTDRCGWRTCTFPATSTWNSWSTVSLTPYLSAGPHTLKVWFDRSSGSGQFLNLDNLRVTGGGPAG